jgi:hypothetical protein
VTDWLIRLWGVDPGLCLEQVFDLVLVFHQVQGLDPLWVAVAGILSRKQPSHGLSQLM